MRERSPRHWEVRVYAGRDPVTGRDRYGTCSVSGTKREARRAMAALVTEVAEGKTGGTGATVETLMRRWLEQVSQRIEPTTLREYRRSVDKVIVPALGAVPLAKLGPEHLDRLYGQWLDQGLKPATVIRRHAAIRAALGQAVRWGWIDRNPGDRAQAPRDRPTELVVPTVEEVRRLLEAAEANDPDMASLIALAALSGARRGELCGWRRSDLDLDRKTAAIRRSIWQVTRGSAGWAEKPPKSHQTRLIKLDTLAVQVLGAQIARAEERAHQGGVEMVADPFVWSRRLDGAEPYRPDWISDAVARLRDKLGLPQLHLHSLRHWHVTQALADGVDVRSVAARVGHRDAAITLRVYAHAVASSEERAARVAGELLEPR